MRHPDPILNDILSVDIPVTRAYLEQTDFYGELAREKHYLDERDRRLANARRRRKKPIPGR